MTAMKELHEIMVTEAQLAEGLAAVLREQQEAIIESRTDDLDVLLQKSEELIQPIASLENERVRLSRQIISTQGSKGHGAMAVTPESLLRSLDKNDAALMQNVILRLRAASHEVLRINRLNKPLLEHAQYFVRQTLRAATDDFKKKLVDKRM